MIDPTMTKEDFEACLVGLPAEMVALTWWDDVHQVAYIKIRDDFSHRAWTVHEVYRCMVRYIDWKHRLSIEKSLKDLVEDTFSKMLTKLFKAEVKYGRNDAWRDDRWEGAWRHSMFHHLVKGDPTDVLIYAAFGMHHNWSTTGVVSDMVHARQELADHQVQTNDMASYPTAVMARAYELLNLCRDDIANGSINGPNRATWVWRMVRDIDDLLPLLHVPPSN